jgi:hypothetical protein
MWYSRHTEYAGIFWFYTTAETRSTSWRSTPGQADCAVGSGCGFVNSNTRDRIPREKLALGVSALVVGSAARCNTALTLAAGVSNPNDVLVGIALLRTLRVVKPRWYFRSSHTLHLSPFKMKYRAHRLRPAVRLTMILTIPGHIRPQAQRLHRHRRNKHPHPIASAGSEFPDAIVSIPLVQHIVGS